MSKNTKIFLLLLAVSSLFSSGADAQSKGKKRWMDPFRSEVYPLVGQGWNTGFETPYDRLPERAKTLVRPELWRLSKQSAGLNLRFKTSASEITVKYTVSGARAMPHMPATGVSGLDMYAKTPQNEWMWVKGNYSFADTISWNFSGLDFADRGELEYVLYLPLYNQVSWLEIGVDSDAVFEWLPESTQKPLVVYGTSIAQGACASRPGMAWTSVLSRELNRPVINLGFSGNGRLENEVLALIDEVDAEIFILDCLPNMSETAGFHADTVQARIVNAVKLLRQHHPAASFLLTDHCGLGGSEINSERARQVDAVNDAMSRAFNSLKTDGVSKIYQLTKQEIGLDAGSTVDGIHSTDRGMVQYADAYAKKILTLPGFESFIKPRK